MTARVLLLVAAAGLSLLLGELVVRQLVPPPGMIRFEQMADAVGTGPRGQFVDLIEPDPERFWRMSSDVSLPADAWPFFGVISNGQGLRENHDIPREKPPGETRVLFLGDSCTFGFLVALEDSYVERAEQALKHRMPGSRVEFINAGVPGYTLFQGFRFLVTEGFDYEPDLVVVSFGWNEVETWDGRSDIEHHAALSAARPPEWLAWSRVATTAWSLQARPSAEQRSERPRLTPVEFSGLLERMRVETATRGIGLLVLAAPGLFNLDPRRDPSHRTPLQQRQIRFGEQLVFGPGGEPGWVDAVAVVQALAQEHSPNELFFDPVHTTPVANAAIAEAIADRIEPWLRARRGP